MFNMGFTEILVLSAIALIVIGPKQLPEIARFVGRMLNEFKRATSDFTSSFSDIKNQANQFVNETKDDIKRQSGLKNVQDELSNLHHDIEDAIYPDEVEHSDGIGVHNDQYKEDDVPYDGEHESPPIDEPAVERIGNSMETPTEEITSEAPESSGEIEDQKAKKDES